MNIGEKKSNFDYYMVPFMQFRKYVMQIIKSLKWKYSMPEGHSFFTTTLGKKY